jgi:hypothetical protein
MGKPQDQRKRLRVVRSGRGSCTPTGKQGLAQHLCEWRRCSVVDITWATPEAFRRVSGWKMAEEVETLSDQLYTFIEERDTTRPAVTVIRIVRGYRAVFHASATVLAASPPLEFRVLRRYTHLRALEPGEDAAEQASWDPSRTMCGTSGSVI